MPYNANAGLINWRTAANWAANPTFVVPSGMLIGVRAATRADDKVFMGDGVTEATNLKPFITEATVTAIANYVAAASGGGGQGATGPAGTLSAASGATFTANTSPTTPTSGSFVYSGVYAGLDRPAWRDRWGKNHFIAEASAENPRSYGGIGDGTYHPLSERYGTLAAAQAAYFGVGVGSLTDSIDWAAIMMAIKATKSVGTNADGFGVEYSSTNGAHVGVGGWVYIPQGVWVVNRTVDFAGTICSFTTSGFGTVIRAHYHAGFDLGAVVSFRKAGDMQGQVGSRVVGPLCIEGDGTQLDANFTPENPLIKCGFDSGGAKAIFHGISARNTGGPGWYYGQKGPGGVAQSEAIGHWNTSFRDCIFERPVGADTRAVPYAYGRGWHNNVSHDNIIFRSTTTANDGPWVWRFEGDGDIPEQSVYQNIWFEYTHTPANGCLLQIAADTAWFRNIGMQDCKAVPGGADTARVRVRSTNTNFDTATGAGGVVIEGVIYGTNAAPFDWDGYGVDIQTSRVTVKGLQGLQGKQVRINGTGSVQNTIIWEGRTGNQSGTQITYVNGASAFNNTEIDHNTGNYKPFNQPWTLRGTGDPAFISGALTGSTYQRYQDGTPAPNTTFYVNKGGAWVGIA